MENNSKTKVTKDLQNKKLLIEREFEAPVQSVWSAWTESELLDQWWMPKPWKAATKILVFEVSGHWLYSSTGPDGTTMWSIAEFTSIDKPDSFSTVCSFCDEEGNKNSEFHPMYWQNAFKATAKGTRVEVEVSFNDEADMEQIIKMGFESGFTMALANLEELLAENIKQEETI